MPPTEPPAPPNAEPTKAATASIRIYEPELFLLLWLRQQRNALRAGQRCVLTLELDAGTFDIVTLETRTLTPMRAGA